MAEVSFGFEHFFDAYKGNPEYSFKVIQAAVDAGPPNPADALTSLAEATMRSGQREQAKRHLIRALETTPRHERAQELLLRIIEGGAMPGDEGR